MSTSKRIPSPEMIRQSMDGLRAGKLSPVDHETREEILDLAQTRVESALPDEVRVLLAQYPPQLIEAYGLLLRWQTERGQYPPSLAEHGSEGSTNEADADGEQAAINTLFGGQQNASQLPISQPQSGAFQVFVQPGQDPLDAIYQAAAGPLIAMHQLSQATHQPTVTFQAGPKMALDTFQGAYKGIVMITEGKGKRAQSRTDTIAVIKDIYEAEQRKLADQGNVQVVEDPDYWLSRNNMGSVYLVGDLKKGLRPEVAWILGDYDPVSAGIVTGIKPTPEQIAAYLHDPDDDKHWYYDVIKMHLRTPQQKQWLEQHDLTLDDILHGNTPMNLSPQLVQVFFQDWNAKLGEHMFGF